MSYDLVVIGTGPGGYVCAIKAAQLGMKVAVVEKRKTHGGTCLNIGCIPSKALLHASEMFEEANHSFEALGIKTSKPKVDWKAMLAHKDKVIDGNVTGIDYLFKKNKIDVHFGTGRVLGAGRVEVKAEDGSTSIVETKNIVIATGSDVMPLPGIEIDEKTVVSSTGALSLDKVPNRMTVVGAGVIGLELGSVYARLGAEVTVVEFMDKILGPMDADVSKQFLRMLKKQGLKFKLSSKVTAVQKKGRALEVTVEPAAGEAAAATLDADVVLVAIGRRPYTEGLGLAEAGVELDERGRVKTDNHYKTNVDGIFAIGDVIAGPMLAHKAEDEGVAVAEMLSGQAGHVNYDVIPGVVYTSPEVASVGKTEEELKAAGIKFKSGKFPFSANGRAKAMLHTDGFVKVLADAETDRVLGVHIVGFGAGEMIHEACVLMEFGGSSEDLGRTCHAHPTMSEAVKEAAMATFAKPIHM
ncbi:Dihydrolipoyl dehydrogenase 3 [Pseudovibrio sp. W64]|uniref:dihydrolipoyl dehydrogenase n=1 Tax=unclassified Pseudovibrio TaxID=2627060 RepID=UPI0007AE5600|nr:MULTISPECIES: dihydrolipoyl dehydrogenase [unclassified Pseudovibrio]KZK87360.1 Dihydrolipoyl dehydrogenase 3 [Pseudovibrio sp. Ad13]KZK88995.1 Dihydrolipoyl dehydrogenase 3 [Pseudovibrio sp. Ad5]KZK89338.1 Dihydrolipoyl dehydrogenase 3 [Pseudovibrio sp. W64]KZK95581.1 Dihydrolipoyl dehydrogenase 3 [Pseudovibrio sp. Ad46]